MTNEQTKAEFKETFPNVKLSRERDGIEPLASSIPDKAWYALIAFLGLMLLITSTVICRSTFFGG